jgi:ribose 5-phosphate isomerase B
MIALASDHTGVELKQRIKELLESKGLEVRDYGTYTADSCSYPVYAMKAARAVLSGECEKGILACGTGIGMSIAANKVKGIRCALLSDCYSAEMSRRHNDTNMMAIGARVTGSELALALVKIWLDTPFEGGRHQIRLNQVSAIEENQSLPEAGKTDLKK